MEILSPLAILGSNPIGVNSVAPMANAPVARANKGKNAFIIVPSKIAYKGNVKLVKSLISAR